MPSAAPGLPLIVVDSREQRPFDFVDHGTFVRALDAGDYSLVGYEDRIAIERKSVSDLLGCMTGGRDRFIRELERLQLLDFSAVVCEGDLQTLLSGESSQMDPRAIVGTLIAWMQRYPFTQWVFAPNRAWAERLTFLFLERFHRDVTDGKRPPCEEANEKRSVHV